MANSADLDQLASSDEANLSVCKQKPTDLDLHCLQRQGISGFSRTRASVFYDHHTRIISTELLLTLVLLNKLRCNANF